MASPCGCVRSKTPPLERQVEDVIDMVGMIFAYVLEDSHLPALVKALLASLQIPVLKIAILEKFFFDTGKVERGGP